VGTFTSFTVPARLRVHEPCVACIGLRDVLLRLLGCAKDFFTDDALCGCREILKRVAKTRDTKTQYRRNVSQRTERKKNRVKNRSG
jgi:hypothetical protein